MKKFKLMNNINRLMVMEFSRSFLWKFDGFDKKILIAILEALPDGTEIRGFGERPHRDVNTILLSHESFPEVREGEIYPEITATITKPGNIVTLDWPDAYKSNHKCEYVSYKGFLKTEENCIVCGKKNE